MSARILVSIGTRPEAIKLAPVVHELRRRPGEFDVRILATAQHRGLLDQILEHFEITPDVDLDLMRADQSLADLTSRMITAVDRVLDVERPDLVVAQGDTTTVMVSGLCSFYRDIPFAHVEAGLRTGNKRGPYPEELNRSIVGRLATLHFAPTDRAREQLMREGVPADAVDVTGNTVIDALQWTAERVGAPPFAVDPSRKLVLVTAHRRENFGAPFEEVCRGVLGLAERDDVDVVFPVHPNPRVAEPAHAMLGGHPRIRLLEPLGYSDFVAAMRAAHLILTDSGGVQEEAPSLGKPVLVLRRETERPEGVEAGVARLVGPDSGAILDVGMTLLDNPAAYAAMAKVANPYGDGHAAARICDRLARQ